MNRGFDICFLAFLSPAIPLCLRHARTVEFCNKLTEYLLSVQSERWMSLTTRRMSSLKPCWARARITVSAARDEIPLRIDTLVLFSRFYFITSKLCICLSRLSVCLCLPTSKFIKLQGFIQNTQQWKVKSMWDQMDFPALRQLMAVYCNL